MQVRPRGKVVPSPLVCREVKVKEGCFIFPTSSRNLDRQGAATDGEDIEAEAMVVYDADNDDDGGGGGGVADDAESESAMMRTRKLAVDGTIIMTGLLKGDETGLNSREGSLVII